MTRGRHLACIPSASILLRPRSSRRRRHFCAPLICRPRCSSRSHWRSSNSRLSTSSRPGCSRRRNTTTRLHRRHRRRPSLRPRRLRPSISSRSRKRRHIHPPPTPQPLLQMHTRPHPPRLRIPLPTKQTPASKMLHNRKLPHHLGGKHLEHPLIDLPPPALNPRNIIQHG